MAPRRRAVVTEENIDQQLQQIHLLDPQSTTENLEQLGPIIQQIHQNRQQDAYTRTLKRLIESKDAEIERICQDNCQDFVGSLGTLSTLRAYTTDLRETITGLDASAAQLGRVVIDKKRGLLQTKKTTAHLDQAIDALQACLRVLDVVDRVGDMIREGKYWNALRSLEDLQRVPANALSQTPLLQHLLSSLPSLRAQIKDAVAANMRQWLLEMREISGAVGATALDAQQSRAKKWRSRIDRDPLLKPSRVGSSVELAFWEKSEVPVVENEALKVDFRPLYQCIHIYTALNSLDELRKSYQADRQAQSDLILPSPLPLQQLAEFSNAVTGFFIIETHVLQQTEDFRAQRDVFALWDSVTQRLVHALHGALGQEKDADAYLKVKEILVTCMQTLESSAYTPATLNDFLVVMLEKYSALLTSEYGKQFDQIIQDEDWQPVYVQSDVDRKAILHAVWLSPDEEKELGRAPLPATLPWSQGFAECCSVVDKFTQKFYAFTDGLTSKDRDLDEVFGKALDTLLVDRISGSIERRLSSARMPQQIGQMITNLEHFVVACTELERSISRFRTAQRGSPVELPRCRPSFVETLGKARERLRSAVTAKLDDFFELAEYNWTPGAREGSPSMYLYELVNWLTTVLDALGVRENDKDDAYRGAVEHVARSLVAFLTGPNIPMLNENALSNVLIDVDFIDDELKRINRAHLSSSFAELRGLSSLILSDTVNEYLVPAVRQSSYTAVTPRALRALLDKLARFGAACRDQPSREKGERRRKEADAVGKIFPGENR